MRMRLSSYFSLGAIISNEFCERWGFYSVRAILVLYLVDRLGLSDDQSVAVYSFFNAGAYLSPFVGSYFADAVAGKYLTILSFTVVYIAGMVLLGAGSAATPSLLGASMGGLALIALGTGGIKPCVSAFGLDQLANASPAAITRFFLLFYFSINGGSVLSYLVTPIVRVQAGYGAAFFLSAGVLGAALLFFLAGTPLYARRAPAGRSVYASFSRVIAASWAAGCGRRLPPLSPSPLLPPPPPSPPPDLMPPLSSAGSDSTGMRWTDAALASMPAEEVFGVAAVIRLLPMLLCLSLFWALFDAQGSVWTLQRRTMRTLCLSGGRACLSTEQLGVVNPLLCLLFVPLMGALTEALRAAIARGALPVWAEPTPLRRMSAGMLLTPLAFALTAGVQAAVDAAPPGSVSILWQLPQFAVITAAEVLVSATGLEFFNTQAPPSMTASVVALYLGTVALGNLITGALYGGLSGVLSPLQLIILLTALMCAASAAFCALATVFRSLPLPAGAEGAGVRPDGGDSETASLLLAHEQSRAADAGAGAGKAAHGAYAARTVAAPVPPRKLPPRPLFTAAAARVQAAESGNDEEPSGTTPPATTG